MMFDITGIIQESIEKLQLELQPLVFNNLNDDEQIIITYQQDDTVNLVIHGPKRLKAYFPKKYEGWPVTFIEYSEKNFKFDFGD